MFPRSSCSAKKKVQAGRQILQSSCQKIIEYIRYTTCLPSMTYSSHQCFLFHSSPCSIGVKPMSALILFNRLIELRSTGIIKDTPMNVVQCRCLNVFGRRSVGRRYRIGIHGCETDVFSAKLPPGAMGGLGSGNGIACPRLSDEPRVGELLVGCGHVGQAARR
jgi:hypothetical protein